jgi:hypothetical protein
VGIFKKPNPKNPSNKAPTTGKNKNNDNKATNTGKPPPKKPKAE